jgi:TolB-like protein/Tfp pilus assembly protein PilF
VREAKPLADQLERLKAALSDRYSFERELGRGGSATVYLVRDLKHDRLVALKVLSPELSGAIGGERFHREIQTSARLQHPHILPLHDSGDADGLLYYVMPYVEGETLRDRLNREKQLPIDDAIQIAREVADALSYAHEHGVIHRDIKPENILLSGGHASVADFGIARAAYSAGSDTQTQTGVSIGTPAYMSPEQASASDAIDGRSDIYSLGCVLYEMLAGQGPFTGATTETLVRQHISEPPPAITTHRPAVSPQVAGALERALAKTPADRFSTAAEFAETIRTPTGTITNMTGVTPAVQSGPRKWAWAVGVAGVVVIAVAAIAYFSGQRGPAIAPVAEESLAGKKMLVVLPFENLGPPEDEYFADGITEEITSHLATVKGLGVIARTSAMQYKGAEKSIDQIGKELGVDYVLEGTVRWQKSPDGQSRIRVTPQLIQVADATHLWADRYDAVMEDVFQVQTDIAEKVVESLDVTLLEPERRALARTPTENLEAYDYYLRGMDYLRNRGYAGEQNLIAVEMFEKAVELDPEFALGWARLSFAHNEMYWFWFDRTEERLDLSKQAVDRAMELAPDSPETYLALGWYYYHGLRQYEPALEQFELARQGLPNSSNLLLAIGAVQRRQGRFEEGAENIAAAAELDPRTYSLALEAGMSYMALRDYETAVRYFDRAISLSPDLPDAYGLKSGALLLWRGDPEEFRQLTRTIEERLGLTITLRGLLGAPVTLVPLLSDRYVGAIVDLPLSDAGRDTAGFFGLKAAVFEHLGEPDSARAHLETSLEWSESKIRSRPDEPYYHSVYSFALAKLGRRKEAVREAKRAVELLPLSVDAVDGPNWLWNLAEVYRVNGQYDEAMDQLEILLEVPGGLTPQWLRAVPAWDVLHGNPRYQKLLGGSV